MLVEIAVADAYGAGFEFVEQEVIVAENKLIDYRAHQLSGIKGSYTDDTQMSLALAELMLKDVEWTQENIAEAFYECYKRDPVHGYAKRLQAAFSEAENAATFARMINSDSFGNGAMMRSVPLGYFNSEAEVIDCATIQASVTHNHPIAIDASVCIALAAHAGLYGKATLSELPEYLLSLGYKVNNGWHGRVKAISEDTLSAVMSNLLALNCYSTLIKNAVNFGGDTDSVAAISCGVASCYKETKKTLPKHLFKNFSKNSYGLAYLADIDSRLRGKYLADM